MTDSTQQTNGAVSRLRFVPQPASLKMKSRVPLVVAWYGSRSETTVNDAHKTLAENQVESVPIAKIEPQNEATLQGLVAAARTCEDSICFNVRHKLSAYWELLIVIDHDARLQRLGEIAFRFAQRLNRPLRVTILVECSPLCRVQEEDDVAPVQWLELARRVGHVRQEFEATQLVVPGGIFAMGASNQFGFLRDPAEVAVCGAQVVAYAMASGLIDWMASLPEHLDLSKRTMEPRLGAIGLSSAWWPPSLETCNVIKLLCAHWLGEEYAAIGEPADDNTFHSWLAEYLHFDHQYARLDANYSADIDRRVAALKQLPLPQILDGWEHQRQVVSDVPPEMAKWREARIEEFKSHLNRLGRNWVLAGRFAAFGDAMQHVLALVNNLKRSAVARQRVTSESLRLANQQVSRLLNEAASAGAPQWPRWFWRWRRYRWRIRLLCAIGQCLRLEARLAIIQGLIALADDIRIHAEGGEKAAARLQREILSSADDFLFDARKAYRADHPTQVVVRDFDQFVKWAKDKLSCLFPPKPTSLFDSHSPQGRPFWATWTKTDLSAALLNLAETLMANSQSSLAAIKPQPTDLTPVRTAVSLMERASYPLVPAADTSMAANPQLVHQRWLLPNEPTIERRWLESIEHLPVSRTELPWPAIATVYVDLPVTALTGLSLQSPTGVARNNRDG